ncbi:MAG: hypothetical protein UV78_C0073G0016 [Parcubacteria group bacterium GW2011_GWA2_43_17]|nr:MAG: hypothetical protein UV78_C0073G0016 [Parcubacteria group bacterium GW2011_GWA2_43_17]KKT94374.1 MAG: hypothetical protein UW91_C0002G0018 [Parcubacteria group bacterium GW2011_GWF2_45_11]KKT98706.1 MAG: hypothetical protein UW98_C0005G0026 [Parcubacteria group bacterium GW2011_GWC2_45_15]
MVILESVGNEHRLAITILKLVAEYIGGDPKPLNSADCVLY